MAEEPLTYHGLCETDGCPASDSEEWHRCFVCGQVPIWHQHWPKKSQAGKGARIVAALCPEHTDLIDNGLWTNGVHQQDGKWWYWVLDEKGEAVPLWTPEGKVAQREIPDPGFPGSVKVARIPSADPPPERLPAPARAESEAPTHIGGVQYSELGLAIPEGLSFEEWEQVGATLGRMNKSWRWWAGDWWLAGERQYGERASQAVTETEYKALSNAIWVAGQIEISRRRENLSWSHHEAVAKLEPEDQDRLLDCAEAEGLTRAQLREIVQAEFGDPKPRECEVSEDGKHHWKCEACGKEKG